MWVAHEAYERNGAAQREFELIEAVRLVAEVQPRVVVEIGCDRGGTLYCWRQLCDRVYGITLAENTRAGGGSEGYPLHDHGAVVWLGDSHDPAALEWLVWELDDDPVDVLFIDGDHSYGGVTQDYETFGPLVRPGGLILLHDVRNYRDPGVDVPRFWDELTESHPDTCRVIARRQLPAGFGVITVGEEGVPHVGGVGGRAAGAE